MKTGIAVAAATLAVLTGGVITPAATAAVPDTYPAVVRTTGATLVGSWNASITSPDGSNHTSVFSFTGGGKACIDYDVPGEGSGHGVGTWTRTGAGTFTMSVRHTVLDPNGTLVGYVKVDQAVTQDGDTLRGSGTSQIQDANGQPTGGGNSSFTAARTSGAEPACG